MRGIRRVPLLLGISVLVLASGPAHGARRWVRFRLSGTPFSFSLPGRWTTRGGPPVSPVEEGKRWTLRYSPKKHSIVVPMPGGWISAQYWQANYLLPDLAKEKELKLRTGSWKGMKTERILVPSKSAAGEPAYALHYRVHPEGKKAFDLELYSTRAEYKANKVYFDRMRRTLRYHRRSWTRYRLPGSRFSFLLPGGWVSKKSGMKYDPVQMGKPWTLREDKEEGEIVIPMPEGSITVLLRPPDYSLPDAGSPVEKGSWKGLKTEESASSGKLPSGKPSSTRVYAVRLPDECVLEMSLVTAESSLEKNLPYFDRIKSSLKLRRKE